jgi:hypothetical protein
MLESPQYRLQVAPNDRWRSVDVAIAFANRSIGEAQLLLAGGSRKSARRDQ